MSQSWVIDKKGQIKGSFSVWVEKNPIIYQIWMKLLSNYLSHSKVPKTEYMWQHHTCMLYHYSNKAKYIEFNQCQWDSIGTDLTF